MLKNASVDLSESLQLTMLNRADLYRWLRALPLNGWMAIACGVTALAIPTAVRAAISGVITGCEFTPYLPFVLISAVLLRWWQAALVALAAVTILGGFFLGPNAAFLNLDCFLSGSAIFLGASAMMIGFAVVLRRVIEANQRPSDSHSGVIFSLEDDQVFASWHGQGAPIRLGSKKRVAAMMEDFLAHADKDSKLPRRFW